ncbi:MAG: glutamate formimidoyltransferase [Elusimicrobia bacterium CG08_land_8_20_14_0_20_59_10]|nr:MAG: glutamate formimidoyltransferase [Elusimicrobia bacterium CG08_land_8_20_14_0_20_59_10]
MGKFVECVPNFSEGRDLDKINKIVDAARAVPGVLVLDVEKDADHNRTVLTFIAPIETASEAMFAVTKKAASLIDLNHHKGEHPRMGATDVAPFIPIMDSTIEDCMKLAEVTGERIGRELNIPVYLYDRAARNENRRDLAKVRKGQFEGLREDIGKNPDRVPDFGPNHIHPTAGAMAVGARNQIVNFNVNLATTDMAFVKILAKKIRTSGGGLPALRAKEIFLESKGQVQLSTVLTDYRTTSIKRVMDELAKELGPKDIAVTGTELIGLTTQDAITDYAVEALQVKDFNKETQVLETKLLKLLSSWQAGANLFVDALANTDPTPGGGSAAAISGAMGCALGAMAIGITLRGKKLEEAKKPALNTLLERLGEHKAQLQNCVSEDSASFGVFMAVMKLPKDDPERKAKMQAALKYAAEVPLKTARLASEALVGLKVCEAYVAARVQSDFRSAAYQLETAIRCAVENVYINAESLEDRAAAEKLTAEAKEYAASGVAAKV